MSVRAYELEMAGIEIREEYAPLLPLVLANREEIQQVILNLVMNAQQAMSDPAGARVLSVRTFMAGPDAVVEVRDTGPGIPTELAGRVFEPFFTTKSAGAGPGLGLSLSLGIANSHQGQLELVSATAGCCFRLTLPGSGFPGPRSVRFIPRMGSSCRFATSSSSVPRARRSAATADPSKTSTPRS